MKNLEAGSLASAARLTVLLNGVLVQNNAVLKGATTCIAWPGEACWHHDDGDVGLATSGSGDTLAGLMGGLLARGLPPLDAALWSVRLHALAGERLAARQGPLGYLARELGAEVPAAMHALCTPPVQRDEDDSPS